VDSARKQLRRQARHASKASGELISGGRETLEDLRQGASELVRETRKELRKAVRDSVREARQAARKAARSTLG
jgi:hypothetical protein